MHFGGVDLLVPVTRGHSYATTRPANADDVPRLVAIEEASFRTDRISRRSFRRQIASPTLALLVATRGDTVRGYVLVSLRRRAKHARIYSLAVDTKGGRGLGRRLMEVAERVAAERGYRLMRLEVNEHNARAIRIYERAGYRRIGRHERYYEDGAAALRYEKEMVVRTP